MRLPSSCNLVERDYDWFPRARPRIKSRLEIMRFRLQFSAKKIPLWRESGFCNWSFKEPIKLHGAVYFYCLHNSSSVICRDGLYCVNCGLTGHCGRNLCLRMWTALSAVQTKGSAVCRIALLHTTTKCLALLLEFTFIVVVRRLKSK